MCVCTHIRRVLIDIYLCVYSGGLRLMLAEGGELFALKRGSVPARFAAIYKTRIDIERERERGR